MRNVIVLGTFHTEIEACTAQELLRIVKEISPEVVFCEAAPEIFPDMIAAEKSFNTPEINAIRELLKESNVKIIPIDIYGNAVDDESIDEMFDLFGQKMENYKNAVLIQIDETYEKGYYFLNSKKNDKINFDKALMEREIVIRENNIKLSLDYTNWLKWNDYREYIWISRINQYFKDNNISKAVFMVGTAHRVRLREKLKIIVNTNQLNVNWNFDYLDS